ncbi:hypothetical protein DL96DRAFT_1565097 [Flagelloscypha sp. PMI_526]|nr:hypothetical protein DL96DRAFT_1565097 [Flagelloscypha sp. PMI_526]
MERLVEKREKACLMMGWKVKRMWKRRVRENLVGHHSRSVGLGGEMRLEPAREGRDSRIRIRKDGRELVQGLTRMALESNVGLNGVQKGGRAGCIGGRHWRGEPNHECRIFEGNSYSGVSIPEPGSNFLR